VIFDDFNQKDFFSIFLFRKLANFSKKNLNSSKVLEKLVKFTLFKNSQFFGWKKKY
jgi:hypothetical protein